MSLIVPEFMVPPDEMLSVFKEEAMPIDTQPTPVSDDLLERRVAIATIYEHDEALRALGAIHIGRVSLISQETGIVHLTNREGQGATNATLVMPETFHTPIALNPNRPNFTTLSSVRALFYVLPQLRSAHA